MVPVNAPLTRPESEPAGLSLRRCVREDLRASTWRQRAVLIATVAWITYEWGFGNETVTPWLLARVISDTAGASSVAMTALVGFVFTASQQLVSGYTALIGFSMFERTSSAAWRLLTARSDDEPKDWTVLSTPVRALVVFTLGTTAVVLIQMTVTGDVGRGRHRRTVVQAATLCGVLVAGIGAAAAALAWAGRSRPALEPATERVLSVLGSPLFWIGLLIVVGIVGSVRRRIAAGAVRLR